MKEALRLARQDSEEAIAGAETDMETERKAQQARVKYREAKLVMETVAGPQNTIKEKERKMQMFIEEHEAALEEARRQKEALAQSRKRELLDVAKDKVMKISTGKLDVVAVKSALEKVTPSAPTADWLESLVNSIDEMLDIERIEVSGSLRDLVQRGQPLKAQVTMVVNGKRVVFTLDYSVADAVGFVRAVLEGAWDAVRDVFEGEEGEE